MMSDYEESNTTYHSDTANTEVFTDIEELEEFESSYSCCLCKCKNPESAKLLEVSVQGNESDSVLRIENIAWLHCMIAESFTT